MARFNFSSLAIRVLLQIGIVIAFLVAGSSLRTVLLSMKRPPERGESTLPGVRVETRVLARAPYRDQITTYGEVKARQRARVAAQVQARVVWVSPRLEAGRAVTAPVSASRPGGEEERVPTRGSNGGRPSPVLIRLDSEDAENARDVALARQKQAAQALLVAQKAIEQTRQANANLAARVALARGEVQTSRQELKRLEDLSGSQSVTTSDLDRQRLLTAGQERLLLQLTEQLDRGKLEVDRLELDLERLRKDEQAAQKSYERAARDVERCAISAPWTGVIEERLVQEGDLVAPGTVLFSIVDPDHLEVAVSVPSRRRGEIGPGSPAKLRLRADGPVIWEGSVSRVSPVSTQDRTFFAFLEVDLGAEERPVLAPGAFAFATIVGREYPDALAVPRAAFLGETVLVARATAGPKSDGKRRTAVLEERTPRVLERFADVALIAEGLEAGEEIVVSGLEQAAPGSRVLLSRRPAEGEAR